MKKMYPDVPHIFVNTGLEHDSVMKHGIEIADEVLRPELDFVNVIKKYGYRDWETDRKSTRLNSSHSAKSRMPSSA